jgi:hypothetical protein
VTASSPTKRFPTSAVHHRKDVTNVIKIWRFGGKMALIYTLSERLKNGILLNSPRLVTKSEQSAFPVPNALLTVQSRFGPKMRWTPVFMRVRVCSDFVKKTGFPEIC